MRFFKTFVASVLMFCVGSVGLLASGVASAADFSNHKVAVITFSLLHNREHGNPDPQEGKTVSNTEVIGNLIAEETNADLFALHTQKLYPMSYDEIVDLAREEQRANARPALKEIPDVSAYDVIFIGYPNWWGTYPMAIATYLESVDLSGKTVIPFCTHEGSRLGRSQSDLEQALPNSKVLDGFECRGGDTLDSDTPDNVKEFLNDLTL